MIMTSSFSSWLSLSIVERTGTSCSFSLGAHLINCWGWGEGNGVRQSSTRTRTVNKVLVVVVVQNLTGRSLKIER